jgi:HlyD family secretion protein
MRLDTILDLAHCTEFRQSVEARPPRVVHGTVWLLGAMLAAALAWAALTRADLVVRAPGLVRPVTTPYKVFAGANGETLSATPGGRVVAVHFREGDEVSAGQVLVELETAQLDNEIAKVRRTIKAGEDELAKLDQQQVYLEKQIEAEKEKDKAVLTQAQSKVDKAKRDQVTNINLAKEEKEGAQYEEETLRRSGRGASAGDLQKARQRVHVAEQKLRHAQDPVDESEIEVARRALKLTADNSELRKNDLARQKVTRQGEVDAARLELDKLEQQRQQATVRARVAGVVTAGDVKVGDILERGRPMAEIAEQKGFAFEVSVPSEEVGRLRVGMPVRVKLDAFDYQRYGTATGTVRSISADSSVPQGGKAVLYVVKIDVDGDEVGRGQFRGQIKLGMAGQAEIVTGQETLLSLFLKKIRQSISLG